MAKLSYPIVMQGLKAHLKKAHISYARLAQNMDMPESTLKKWFIAEDGSFNRINLICEALGIPVHVLIKSVEDQKVLTLTFSSEQQSMFIKDPMAFRIYWLLVYERKNEIQILQQLRLQQVEYKRTLLKLDRLNLIEVGQNDKIKLPKMKPIRWKFQGAFMVKLREEWTQGILHSSNETRNEMQFFQLSESSADELKKDLAALEEKYARRTIIELSSPVERIQLRYLNALADGSFVEG